jgi:hypothetical protein
MVVVALFCVPFSRKNQWTSVDNVGHYPLVLDPTIAGMTVTKVLIDGGAGLNIIFADTLRSRLCWPTNNYRYTLLRNSTWQSGHASRPDYASSHLRNPGQLLY